MNKDLVWKRRMVRHQQISFTVQFRRLMLTRSFLSWDRQDGGGTHSVHGTAHSNRKVDRKILIGHSTETPAARSIFLHNDKQETAPQVLSREY